MDTCAKNSVRGLSLFLFALLTAIVLSVLPGDGRAAVINVPDDQPSIQDGIVAANFFDTVMVAPGRYYENIDFLGKWIVVTSRFALDNDPSYIFNTIIDGSQPVHPDSASCVLMVTHENNFSILQGFTLTGGTGTNWVDEHGAGTFREGGGILMTESSPIIQYNYIVDNEAVFVPSGLVSAGGGGIRIGDGDPLIQNNIIGTQPGTLRGRNRTQLLPGDHKKQRHRL